MNNYELRGKDYILGGFTAGISGLNLFSGLNSLLRVSNAHTSALELVLAQNPELTKQAYNTAQEMTNAVASGDMVYGCVNMGCAVLMGVLAYKNLTRT